MRTIGAILPTLTLGASQALGQTTIHAPALVADSPPLSSTNETTKAWSFSTSVYTYLVPEDRDYVQPTITFDRDWLHLEARCNYEDLDTGSAWVGYNFSGGEKLAWAFTPMLGGVFGNTPGIAAGYKGSLNYWKLELYSEGEYVFDSGDSSRSFFYTWSEFALAPVDWFRVGLVIQRTKLYETDFDIQRGFLVGVSFRRADFTTYLFNPDDKLTVVLGASVRF